VSKAVSKPLRVLFLEDLADDAALVLRELQENGYEVTHKRVDTAQDMRAALQNDTWDVVLSDFRMPGFTAIDALAIFRESQLDIPFIIISGTIGEDAAVDALKAGAHDFLVKGRLARLVPAIERELREAGARKARRIAEEALRVSEERFRSLVNSMDDVVYTLDRNQRCDGVYGRWIESEGLTAEQLIGKTVRDRVGPEAADRLEAASARALAGERVVCEWSYQAANGIRHFHTSFSPREGRPGEITGVVSVGREITEQRKLQEQLQVSDRMASVGTLAAGIAHEINNPLSSVLANLEFALRDVTELTKESPEPARLSTVTHELTDAHEAAERVRRIVQDLRILSRADSEERQAVDAERVMESAVRIALNEIRHRARLFRDYMKVPPVLASESRLGQVFLNILVNAAQALQEGEAERNEIRITTRQDGDQVVVGIGDTGPGIPAEILKHLFTPFFTTKPVGVGMGLGLSICHRIISGYGGRIDVETEVGKGTWFRIRLPVALSPVKTRHVTPVVVVKAPRRGRVLVIDDEPMVTRAIRRTLSDEHEVVTVDRARRGLEMIQTGDHFDVILCDLMMPEMSGIELHAELQKHAPRYASSMIFLTGGAFTPRAREFLEKMPNRWVEKPFDVAELRKLVNRRVS
jgi:PAS domain S-box-containing protein